MRRHYQLLISLALTLLVGFIIYRSVPDWGKAWSVMIQGQPGLLLAGFSCVMLHMILRATRWGVLLSPVKRRIAFRNLFSLTLIKYVINVIPPRVGEVVASVLLARKEHVPAVSVIGASLLERILDMLTVVLIFFFYLSFFSDLYTPSSEREHTIMLAIQSYSIKGFAVFCLGVIFLFLSLRHSGWLNWLPAIIRRYLAPFLEGFRALHMGGALLKVAGLSLAIWLIIACQLWFMTLAYLNAFPFLGGIFLMIITVVGVAIPTPAGLGGFQFFMNLGLVNFFAQYLSRQDASSQAAGISNGCYIVSMIPIILGGLVFMNHEGLSFRKISHLTETKGGAPGPS